MINIPKKDHPSYQETRGFRYGEIHRAINRNDLPDTSIVNNKRKKLDVKDRGDNAQLKKEIQDTI